MRQQQHQENDNQLFSKLIFLFIIFNLYFTFISYSQNVGINNTGTSGDPSAMLDINSTSQGLLIPRMTTAGRNTIASPVESLLIYNTDIHCFEAFYNGAWVHFGCLGGACQLPALPGSISGDNPVCQNQRGVNYSVINKSGVTYDWTYSGTGLTITSGNGNNSINADFSASATAGTLTCTPSNACGNGTASTIDIAFATAPYAPTADGTTICSGLTTNLMATAPGGTYKWFDAESGGTLLSTGNYFTTPALTSTTTFYVQTTIFGCTSLRTAVTVTITACTNPPSQPSDISGSANPCINCDAYYSVSDASCVLYNWSVPFGWTISYGQGSHSISVKPGNTNGYITVTPSNGCGTGPSRTLAVNPKGYSYTFPPNNSAGNLFIFSNYDGGTLTIDVDVNIPNIKIGVVSYATSNIVITGTYAANVTQVRWAGYNSSTISGAPGSGVVRPVSPIINPCGNNLIICNYTCFYSNCGGCNSPDQIIEYFTKKIFPGSVFNFHRTYYNIWNSPEKLSTGSNCSY